MAEELSLYPILRLNLPKYDKPPPILKGFLAKKPRRNFAFGWNTRYFVLEEGILSYYSSPNEHFPLGFIALKEIMAIEYNKAKDSGRRFELKLRDKTYLLSAESAASAEQWVDAIRSTKEKADDEKVMNKSTPTAAASNNRAGRRESNAKEGSVISSLDSRFKDRYEGTKKASSSQLVISLYRTARQRPAFYERLMQFVRTDEEALRVILHILVESNLDNSASQVRDVIAGFSTLGPTTAAKYANQLHTLQSFAARGSASTQDSNLQMDDDSSTRDRGASIMPDLETDSPVRRASRRNSACSRFNPSSHMLVYTRLVPFDVDNLPLPDDQSGPKLSFGQKDQSSSILDLPRSPSTEELNSDSPRQPQQVSSAPNSPGSSSCGSSTVGSAPGSPVSAFIASAGMIKTRRSLPTQSSSGTEEKKRPIIFSSTKTLQKFTFTSNDRQDSLASVQSRLSLDTNRSSFRKKKNSRNPSISDTLRLPLSTRSAIKSNTPKNGTSPTATLHRRRSSDMPTIDARRNSLTSLQHARTPSTGPDADELSKRRHSTSKLSAGLEQLGIIEQSDKQNVYEWLLSDDFMNELCLLFQGDNYEAQNLALKVAYILIQRHAHANLSVNEASNDECVQCTEARNQFSLFVSRLHTLFCSTVNLNTQVKYTVTSLIEILTTNVEDFNKSSRSTSEVRNAGVWHTIFTSLKFSEFHTRRETMYQINGLLINQTCLNRESILAHPDWQYWILPLLCDLPNVLPNKILERIYLYTVNIYLTLHYHCFSKYNEGPLEFASVMKSSLLAPLQAKEDKLHLMRAFIFSMLYKVRTSHLEGRIFLLYDGVVWSNLRQLLKFAKAFLFCTPTSHFENLQALYEREEHYGLHSYEELSEDLRLIDVACTLLEALHLDRNDSPVGSDIAPHEKEAFDAIKNNDELSFFRDAAVFLPMLHSIEDLAGPEIEAIVREFLCAPNSETRRKVFKNAEERHRTLAKAQLKAEIAANKKIEQLQCKSQKEQDVVVKILLLGPGESGKSTIFKQIQMIYGNGYGDKERREFVPVIFDNIVSTIKTLCHNNTSLAEEFPDLKISNSKTLGAFRELSELEAPFTLTPEIAHCIKILWADKAFRSTCDYRSRFQLPAGDASIYYIERLDELLKPGYIPSTQDILRSRVRTCGIVESEFSIKNNRFNIVDVGGQRNERKKWIHYFAHVTSIIFVVAASEYDQTMMEDEKTNRMEDSMELFQEISNNEYFKTKPIIFFLNKADLFAEKLFRSPLSAIFPEFADTERSYSGRRLTAEEFIKEGCACVLRRFLGKDRSPGREIFPHVTCATDTNQVKAILDATRVTLVKEALRDSGLM